MTEIEKRIEEIRKLHAAATPDMLQWADDQVLMNWIRNSKPDIAWLITQLKASLKREAELVVYLQERVLEHRGAYSTDIIPDYDLKTNPNPSIDQVAGKMGRHMCDCFLRYIEEAKHRASLAGKDEER